MMPSPIWALAPSPPGCATAPEENVAKDSLHCIRTARARLYLVIVTLHEANGKLRQIAAVGPEKQTARSRNIDIRPTAHQLPGHRALLRCLFRGPAGRR